MAEFKVVNPNKWLRHLGEKYPDEKPGLDDVSNYIDALRTANAVLLNHIRQAAHDHTQLVEAHTPVECGNAAPGGEPIARCKQGSHVFSRRMDQEYPRKCIKCGATEQPSPERNSDG